MSFSTIRASLKTTLEGVTDIANVHDYIRHWGGSTEKFLGFFSYRTTANTDELQAWEITRTQTPEVIHNQNITNLRRHNWLIFGFLRVDDELESEKTFQDLVEDVSTALRDNTKQDNPFTALRAEPPQVGSVEHRMIGNRLCHAVNITILIEEYIQF